MTCTCPGLVTSFSKPSQINESNKMLVVLTVHIGLDSSVTEHLTSICIPKKL